MKIQFQYSIPSEKKKKKKKLVCIIILKQEETASQKVKCIRRPGIKVDFTWKFLKLGSVLLLLSLPINRHKQTLVHLGERKSPGKGAIPGPQRRLVAP